MTIKTSTSESAQGNCGKCGGTGYIGAFRHIANGCCFECNGSGVVAFRVYSEGLHRDEHGAVVYFLEEGTSACLVIKGGYTGGICDMPRKLALDCIKDSLDTLNDPEIDSDADHYFAAALRLAALGDERADKRALAYVKSHAPALRVLLPMAKEVITLAKKMA